MVDILVRKIGTKCGIKLVLGQEVSLRLGVPRRQRRCGGDQKVVATVGATRPGKGIRKNAA